MEKYTIHFNDACDSLELLCADGVYIFGIKEASQWERSKSLRHMFALLLLLKSTSKPEYVQKKHGSYYQMISLRAMEEITQYRFINYHTD